MPVEVNILAVVRMTPHSVITQTSNCLRNCSSVKVGYKFLRCLLLLNKFSFFEISAKER